MLLLSEKNQIKPIYFFFFVVEKNMKIIRDDFYVRLLCEFNLRCVLYLVTFEIKVVKMDALDMEMANEYSRKTVAHTRSHISMNLPSYKKYSVCGFFDGTPRLSCGAASKIMKFLCKWSFSSRIAATFPHLCKHGK